jgi:hypothetical protein
MSERCEYNEMAGTFAIVGCEENPNFQVWGARSDLRCKRNKKKEMLKMKFKDWIESTEKKDNA